MDSIPTEVLANITSYLFLKDTLTCITVFQKWNQIIAASNLYLRLHIATQKKRKELYHISVRILQLQGVSDTFL